MPRLPSVDPLLRQECPTLLEEAKLAAVNGPIGIDDAKRLWDLACESPGGISVVKWNAIERVTREFNLDPIADFFLKSAMKTGKDLREKPAKPPRGDNSSPKSVFSRFSQPAPREKVNEQSQRLRRGQLVLLHGFVRTTALNGRRGRLQYYDEFAGRWLVQMKGDKLGVHRRIDPKNISLSAKPASAKGKRQAKVIAPEPQPATMPEDPEQAVEFLLRQMEQAKSVSQVERLQKRMHAVLKGKGLREDMMVEVRELPGEDTRNGARVKLVEFDMTTHWAVRFEDSKAHGDALQNFPASKLFKPDPIQDAPHVDSKVKGAKESPAAVALVAKNALRMKRKPFAKKALAAQKIQAEQKAQEALSRKGKKLITAPMLKKDQSLKKKMQKSELKTELAVRKAKSQQLAACVKDTSAVQCSIPVDSHTGKEKSKKKDSQTSGCPGTKRQKEAAVAEAMKEAREAMVAAVEKVAREAAEAMIDRELSSRTLMKRPASAAAVVGAAWEAAENAAKQNVEVRGVIPSKKTAKCGISNISIRKKSGAILLKKKPAAAKL